MLTLDQYLQKRRIPFSVLFELTDRCNLRCEHCYGSLGVSPADELTLDKIISILDELHSHGTMSITFSGGEVFMRKDIVAILKSAVDKQFRVAVYSNATLLTDAMIDILASLGIASFEISLYGHTPDIHDAVTRIPGSFAATWRSATHLRRVGLAVVLRCVVMESNIRSLSHMKHMAQELGATFKYDPVVIPRKSGDCSNLCVRISSAHMAAYCSEHADLDLYKDLLCGIHGPPTNLERPVCLAGSTLCTIAANGDVYPCMTLTHFRLGSLAHESFASVWQRASRMQDVLALKHFTECIACPNLPICAWCPGHAALEHNNLYVPVKEFCRMTSFIRDALSNVAEPLHNREL